MKRGQEKSPSPASQSREITRTEISNAELVVFLRQLAVLYRSPTTGNPPLSKALDRLALWVRKEGRLSSAPAKAQSEALSPQSTPDVSTLRALDAGAVERFVADEQKTKVELANLAYARFSIPRSQLLKLPLATVRETIKAALLHENSLEIISQEAKRDGSKRSS